MMPEEKEFFNDAEEKPVETEKEEAEKIKVGEAEYTQDELNKLVEIGKIGIEAEEKYNRPITKYWPEYTKSQQRVGELEKQLETLDKAKKEVSTEIGQLSKEQVKEQAIRQADEIGLIHKGNIKQYVDEQIEGYRILDNVDKTIAQAIEKGQPEVSAERLIEHMTETGIRQPDKAYKDLFEDKLDSWKEQQLKKVKPEPIATQEASTAGAKQPPGPARLTKDNLQDTMREHFRRLKGSENA